MGFVKWIDEQSTLIKVLLFIPIWGWVLGFLYRLFKFINDTSKTMTLVGAILFFVPFVGWLLGIVEWILVIINGKPTILAE